MAKFDIVAQLAAAVRETKDLGELPALRAALQTMDLNRNGRISFDELIAPTHIERECRSSAGPRGYTCDGRTSAAFDYSLMIQGDVRDALREYAAYRQDHGPVPGPMQLVGNFELSRLNGLMRRENLPVFEVDLLTDAMAYGDRQLPNYRRNQNITLPAPRFR